MTQKISLTGIKPSGTPHIGNYFGAIKPALELVKTYDARYFIADYHALNTVKDPKLLEDQTYDLAATWLACGLDPEQALLYRQSDIPETFELTTNLMAFTAKGMMNRAHAYKANIALNQDAGKDQDLGINMGLYTYPVLMAADILLFDTNLVPVGKDQKQHVEMTADIAQSVNHVYKQELLVIPEPLISEETKIIKGLDGRKMSKSYNNVIPLFLPTKKFRKIIMKIVTNSQGVEEVKDPNNCSVFSFYKLFASDEQIKALKNRYLAGGMGWGHAKQELFEVMEAHFSPMREEYNKLIADRAFIDETLKKGAEKARIIAANTLNRLRKATGIAR
ncbi:MAG: tryptophan--tRNA ligase [Candidatus Marinimicrobia bacterium]|nr:tryptophan--tRNA ligase [Candidatus Neomarinimicrobiota bacterium]